MIDEAVVDRAVTRYGDHTIWDVYHTGEPVETAEVLELRAVEEPPLCVSPGCSGTPLAGGSFCAGHADLLARVRAEYRADAERFTSTIRRPNAAPKCCNPSCWNARPQGVRFCAECELEGWTEEVGE